MFNSKILKTNFILKTHNFIILKRIKIKNLIIKLLKIKKSKMKNIFLIFLL